LTQRLHGVVRGAVQGVGFRPYVFRLAHDLQLPGWVLNSSQGVFLEVEGTKDALDEFVLRLPRELPPRACIQSFEFSFLDPVGFTSFEIRASDESGPRTALVLPDIATCDACLAELFSPADRRFRYPFINCTHCGPRYSIIQALPYDRAATTMRHFTMCPVCAREYANPLDRRFHAQPNACPACGPQLELWDHTGRTIAHRDQALTLAISKLREGMILAVKGIGGFHLMTRATDDDAVRRLRARKHREEKPFALMFPSLDAIAEVCSVGPLEERLLRSPEAPIVLLRRQEAGDTRFVAPSVAPKNPTLGIMLPYAPLHHLILHDLQEPLVATSGNISDEPICTDEHEAVQRLSSMADFYLVHNRSIARHVDDSITRVILGRELVLRRARGFAPLPVRLNGGTPPTLAVGAHLKNTIAIARDHDVFVSQHIGDLESKESLDAFHREITDLESLFAVEPAQVVSDSHPDYLSSAYARSSGRPHVTVQHHYAHVASCMAENTLDGRVLGVAWDGTGWGPDGTIWGGEFLLTDSHGFRRIATLRSFTLPGGEQAIQEPRRSALGLLFEMYGPNALAQRDVASLQTFSREELTTLTRMIEKGIHSPRTSSAGRLFDGISSLLDVRHRNSFEGQAAMELEFLAFPQSDTSPYPFEVRMPGNAGGADKHEPAYVADWGPMVEEILNDVRNGQPPHRIASRMHATLARIIVAVSQKVGEERIVLTGGCFQNRVLLEATVAELRSAGFRPYWHQRIPPNDGGIALGQVYAAARLTGGVESISSKS
jgi:hydrogenase maturation protein HypF